MIIANKRSWIGIDSSPATLDTSERSFYHGHEADRALDSVEDSYIPTQFPRGSAVAGCPWLSPLVLDCVARSLAICFLSARQHLVEIERIVGGHCSKK